MTKCKYYVRVQGSDIPEFEKHLTRNSITGTRLQGSNVERSVLYAATMDTEQELNLKLSFPLVGCMNFQKTIGRQIKQRSFSFIG